MGENRLQNMAVRKVYNISSSSPSTITFNHITTDTRCRWIGERIKFKPYIPKYNVWITVHRATSQTTSDQYRTILSWFGGDHQSPLMYSCQQRKLTWVISPFGSLAQCLNAWKSSSTYSGSQKSLSFKKTI